jgi:hypothetical protein
MSEEINERPPVPEAIANRPPSMEQCARETFNLRADWQLTGWERKGNSPDYTTCQFMEIKGGVYPHVMLSGKRKGQTNYRKPEPGTETVVALTPSQLDAWLLKWEAETGYCHECSGTGLRWSGWNHERGNRYEPCKRCKATGIDPNRCATEHTGEAA